MRGKGALYHPSFDPSRREGRSGRDDLRVTHPTWTRKREGKVAWCGKHEMVRSRVGQRRARPAYYGEESHYLNSSLQ